MNSHGINDNALGNRVQLIGHALASRNTHALRVGGTWPSVGLLRRVSMLIKPFLVLTDACNIIAHKLQLVISKLGNVKLSLTFANLRFFRR